MPPPDLIDGYQRVIPNGGERVLALAEREQEHRHRSEDRGMRLSAAAHFVGQSLAFVLSAMIVVFGYELLRHGDSVAGYGTLLVGAASLLSAAFRKGKATSSRGD
ncbi:MAG: DUF2335 domain-containing protein [Solirubrobacteraceae bacterium]